MLRSVLLLALGISTSALQLSVRSVGARAPIAARRIGCDIVCGWGPDPVWKANKIESISDADKDGSLKARMT